MVDHRRRDGRRSDAPSAALGAASGRIRLSSPATPGLRVVPLVVAGGGVAFFVAQAQTGKFPAWGYVVAAFGFAAAVSVVVLLTGLLWNVWLEDDLLICSRFTARKEIPLSEIKDVALRRVGDDSRIRITLRDFSSYGRRLTFMPVDFKRRKGKPAEIVALLRQRAKLDVTTPATAERRR